MKRKLNDRQSRQEQRQKSFRKTKNILKDRAKEYIPLIGKTRGYRFTEPFYCGLCGRPAQDGVYYKNQKIEISICITCREFIRPTSDFVSMVSTPMGGKR